MANDFNVQLPQYPIPYSKYDEYAKIASDPDALAEIPLQDLYQMQAEMKQHNEARAALRQRLQEEGLNEEQILRVEAAQRASEIDPNAGGPENLRETVRQEPQRDVTGLGEGALQAVEGVADLAMDISVSLGLDSPEDRRVWKENVNEARTVRREAQMATLGQLPGPVYEMVGEVIPWLAASGGSAANYLRFIARNAFLGAAGTAAQFQPEGKELSDRSLDALVGTGFGALFGAAFAIPSMAKRAGARSIIRTFNDADSQQRELVELLVQELTNNPNFKFSAAQITGSRFYQNLELATADKLTKAQQNSNLDTLYNNLLLMIDRQGASGKTASQIAIGLRETLKKAKDDIYQQASSQWGRGAEAIIRKWGDEAVVDGRAYLKKLDQMIAEQNDTLLNMGQKPSDNLVRYRNEVDNLVNPAKVVTREEDGVFKVFVRDSRTGEDLRVLGESGSDAQRKALMREAQRRADTLNDEFGGPTAEETLRILKGLNDLIGGKTVIFEEASASSNRTIGRALMGAFTDSMEAAPRNAELAGALKNLREGYRMDMATAEALNRTIFNRIFGGKDLPADPGKKLDMILKGEKEDLVGLREFLEEYNPELLYELRATHLSRIFKGSTSPTRPSVDTPVDLNKFAKNLADTFGRAGKAGSGLHNPQTQRDMLLTAEALRVLAGKQFKGVVPGGVRPEEWTINLISRSPEFFGRFITRAFASGQTLEQALLDPAWRKAVQTIANGDLSSNAGKGALLFLATWWRDSEEKKANAEAQAAQMEESRRMAEQGLRQGGPL